MNILDDAPTISTDFAGGGPIQAVWGEGGEGNNGAIDDSHFPDNWNDLWKLDEPLDWDAFLKSELLLKERSNLETYTILNRISGSISIIASALLVIHILRSPEGLSTTYHRLMFGISITDILYSSAFCLGSLMVPKELDYMTPGAQGNVGTCTFQGFLIFVGVYISAYYNCSICFYYLAIIKYNKSDAYIAKKLERWFHGVPIIVPVLTGILFVAVKFFNSSGGHFCFVRPYIPPHCIGYEDGEIIEGFSIPCGRGNSVDNNFFLSRMVILGVAILPPVIISTTMVMMYRTVLKIERKSARYGVGALRLHVQQDIERVENDSNDDATSTTLTKIMKKIQCFISHRSYSLWCFLTCCRYSNNASNPGAADAAVVIKTSSKDTKSTISTKKRVSRKKSILQIASGYVAAWVIIWVPGMVPLFFLSVETLIVSSLLVPLQGLFNFMVFMSPKVRAAKKPRRGKQQDGDLSWFKACLEAYMLSRPRKKEKKTMDITL